MIAQSSTNFHHAGFSLLDKEDTHWKSGFCPYAKASKGGEGSNVIERIDEGATFYRKHFFGKGKTPLVGISFYNYMQCDKFSCQPANLLEFSGLSCS